jgi:hypothetical protein
VSPTNRQTYPWSFVRHHGGIIISVFNMNTIDHRSIIGRVKQKLQNWYLQLDWENYTHEHYKIILKKYKGLIRFSSTRRINNTLGTINFDKKYI